MMFQSLHKTAKQVHSRTQPAWRTDAKVFDSVHFGMPVVLRCSTVQISHNVNILFPGYKNWPHALRVQYILLGKASGFNLYCSDRKLHLLLTTNSAQFFFCSMLNEFLFHGKDKNYVCKIYCSESCLHNWCDLSELSCSRLKRSVHVTCDR